MTTTQLIRELKKYPPNYEVGYQGHDGDEDSPCDKIGSVWEASDTVKNLFGVDIVLRW